MDFSCVGRTSSRAVDFEVRRQVVEKISVTMGKHSKKRPHIFRSFQDAGALS